MRGEAFAHGAATIVNAIATGKGAAFGLGLRTWVEVEITSSPGIEVTIEGFQGEDTALVARCVEATMSRFRPDEGLGARVRTKSDIPISRGLKSSSAAANAAIAATLKALNERIDSLEAIRIGTRCAIETGVSVTGAFDDACASWFGGVVVTDNAKEEIVLKGEMPGGLKALIHVPSFQIRKASVPIDKIRSLAGVVEVAYSQALAGDYLTAMTLNGLCYSAALGLDQTVALESLRKGARAAGLSGTGPATVVLVDEGKVDEFLNSFEGTEFIIADICYGPEEGK